MLGKQALTANATPPKDDTRFYALSKFVPSQFSAPRDPPDCTASPEEKAQNRTVQHTNLRLGRGWASNRTSNLLAALVAQPDVTWLIE